MSRTARAVRWTDDDIREELRAVDEGDREVGRWAADFLENVLYRYTGPLSEKQRRKALQIIQGR